jgi:hypothetical protein
LAVKIERRCAVADENPQRDEPIQGGARPAVDPGVVWINVFGEIDIGAPYMEKAVGIAPGKLRGFLPVYDIIRHGGYPGRKVWFGTKGIKGME